MGFISESMSKFFQFSVTFNFIQFNEIYAVKFRHMVECSRCLEWYHRMCERIPDSVLNDSDKIWYCQLCLQEQEKNGSGRKRLIHND